MYFCVISPLESGSTPEVKHSNKSAEKYVKIHTKRDKTSLMSVQVTFYAK